MTFFTPTNLSRVEKMTDTVELIAKSAKSNKADGEAIITLFRPLIVSIEALVAQQGGSPEAPAASEALPAPTPAKPAATAPARSPTDFCEGRSIPELMDVIYTATLRLDEALVREGFKK
jgi:hypothetical protein